MNHDDHHGSHGPESGGDQDDLGDFKSVLNIFVQLCSQIKLDNRTHDPDGAEYILAHSQHLDRLLKEAQVREFIQTELSSDVTTIRSSINGVLAAALQGKWNVASESQLGLLTAVLRNAGLYRKLGEHK